MYPNDLNGSPIEWNGSPCNIEDSKQLTGHLNPCYPTDFNKVSLRIDERRVDDEFEHWDF